MSNLVKGSNFKVVINSDELDYETRKKIYEKMRNDSIEEKIRIGFYYAGVIATGASILLAVFSSPFMIILTAILAIITYNSKMNYLRVWSRKRRYGKKTMVRVDLGSYAK